MNDTINTLRDISKGISSATSVNIFHLMSVPPSDSQKPSLIHGIAQSFLLSNTASKSLRALDLPAHPWTARCLSLLPLGVMLVGSRSPDSRAGRAALMIHHNLGHVISAVNVIATVTLALQMSPALSGVTLGMLSIQILTRSKILPLSVNKTITVSNTIFSLTMVTLFGTIWQKIWVTSIYTAVYLPKTPIFKPLCQKIRDFIDPVPQNLSSDEVTSLEEIERLNHDISSEVSLVHLYRKKTDSNPLQEKVDNILLKMRLDMFHQSLPDGILTDPNSFLYKSFKNEGDVTYFLRKRQEIPLLSILFCKVFGNPPDKNLFYPPRDELILKLQGQLKDVKMIVEWWKKWKKKRGITSDLDLFYSDASILEVKYLMAMLIEMGVLKKTEPLCCYPLVKETKNPLRRAKTRAKTKAHPKF